VAGRTGNDQRRQRSSPGWEGAATEMTGDGSARCLDGKEQRRRRSSPGWGGAATSAQEQQRRGRGRRRATTLSSRGRGSGTREQRPESGGGAASPDCKCRDGVDLPCRMGSQTPCNFRPGPNGVAGVRPRERSGIHPGFFVSKGALDLPPWPHHDCCTPRTLEVRRLPVPPAVLA
jgi:hypothetical protein